MYLTWRIHISLHQWYTRIGNISVSLFVPKLLSSNIKITRLSLIKLLYKLHVLGERSSSLSSSTHSFKYAATDSSAAIARPFSITFWCLKDKKAFVCVIHKLWLEINKKKIWNFPHGYLGCSKQLRNCLLGRRQIASDNWGFHLVP